MKLARSLLLLKCAMAVALAQSGPPNVPADSANEPRTLVASLYREVVARHPHDIPNDADLKIFSPYLSQALLHKIEDARACSEHWDRQNPEPHLRAEMAAHYDVFSGDGYASEPIAFRIQKISPRKDGSPRVYVRLKSKRIDAYISDWRVAAVVLEVGGRYVVDDVIYISDRTYDDPSQKPADPRLSEYLAAGCEGAHWIGNSMPDDPKALARSLYQKVVARAPSGIPTGIDWKIFAPYMSKTLLHRIDDFDACAAEWFGKHHDPKNPVKAPFGVYESGIFSGGDELTGPRSFRVETVRSQKDGSVSVSVRLAWWEWQDPKIERDQYHRYADKPWIWHVALQLLREDGRYVIDDVAYLKPGKGDSEFGEGGNEKDYRLSQELASECDGPHYVGSWVKEHRKKQTK